MMTKNDHQHDGLMLILTQIPIGDQAKVNNSYSRMQRSYGNGEEDDPLQVSPNLKHKHHIMFETLETTKPKHKHNVKIHLVFALLF